jgi:hypothetical protein
MKGREKDHQKVIGEMRRILLDYLEAVAKWTKNRLSGKVRPNCLKSLDFGNLPEPALNGVYLPQSPFSGNYENELGIAGGKITSGLPTIQDGDRSLRDRPKHVSE